MGKHAKPRGGKAFGIRPKEFLTDVPPPSANCELQDAANGLLGRNPEPESEDAEPEEEKSTNGTLPDVSSLPEAGRCVNVNVPDLVQVPLGPAPASLEPVQVPQVAPEPAREVLEPVKRKVGRPRKDIEPDLAGREAASQEENPVPKPRVKAFVGIERVGLHLNRLRT